MTWKFTYKELLLVVGVIVALAIVTVFWFKDSSVKTSANTPANLKKMSIVSFSAFLEKSVPKVELK